MRTNDAYNKGQAFASGYLSSHEGEKFPEWVIRAIRNAFACGYEEGQSELLEALGTLGESLEEWMNQHTNGTSNGPCCPPGQCKARFGNTLNCSVWKGRNGQ